MSEHAFELRPGCSHRDCPFCASDFWRWVKARMAQMSIPQTKRGETVSFAEAAATSIIPPKER